MMMNKQHTIYQTLFTLSIALIGSSIMLINQAALAMSPEEACKMPRYNIWKGLQTERLWSPDEETLFAEQSGKVFAYHCFTREEVNRFFDTHPDRIENANFHPILEDNPENNMLASVTDEDC
jgi:hypothetical protein